MKPEKVKDNWVSGCHGMHESEFSKKKDDDVTCADFEIKRGSGCCLSSHDPEGKCCS